MYSQESLFDVECMSHRGEVAQDEVRDEADFDNDAVVKSEGGAAGPRKVYTMEEVDDKIHNLTKPPSMRDEAYFCDVCGLYNRGTNPHRLQVKKHILLSSLHGLFGEGRGRSGFKYTDCEDANVRRFLEDIWPICYERVGMPASKLIAKEFCLGIVAQFHQKMDVDWAAFAAETNASQRGKYTTHLRRWQTIRLKLCRDLGIVGEAVEPPIQSMANTLQEFQGLGLHSEKWTNKLSLEIRDLLSLATLQREVSKLVENALKDELSSLADKCRAQRMLRDSVHASLLEEIGDLDSMVSSEARRDSTSSIASTPMQPSTPAIPLPTGLSSTSDTNVVQDAHPTIPIVTLLCELESDEVLATRMKQNFLKGLHVKHEARYQTLRSLNEIKDKAWKEMEERRDFLLRYSKSLTEQDVILKNK
jgi:hypothetical protein